MKKEELALLCRTILDETGKVFQKTQEDMVYGDGNPDALVMLVGEAPGAEETRLKKPFVGKAGENLNEFLHVLEMKREEIYITNVVKFRPYLQNEKGGKRNRPPQRREQIHQAPYLHREIALIRPKLVVTLGNVALRCVSNQNSAVIGNMHGKTVLLKGSVHDFLLFPLYHPASIIYNRSLQSVYEEDLKALKACLQSL